MLRKERKTLGGYFFLPHPVDLDFDECRKLTGVVSNANKSFVLSLHSQSTAIVMPLPADMSLQPSDLEELTVNRLPEEPLGMQCDVIDDDAVTGFPRGGPRVMVRRVVQGSPAERATGGNRGLAVGDEILAINGVRLTNVSRDEILQFISETPLTLNLLIRRRRAGRRRPTLEPSDDRSVNRGSSNSSSEMPGYALQTCKPSVLHEGFEVRQVSFHKLAHDKLGLKLERRGLDFHLYSQVNYRAVCTQPHLYDISRLCSTSV